jgi:hypothetical protein
LLEVPDSVLTVTETVPEDDVARVGTVAWHVFSLGHTTDASVEPNVTVMIPSALKSPVPVRVTTWPATPEAGEMAAMTGPPPGGGEGREDDVAAAEVEDVTRWAGPVADVTVDIGDFVLGG